MNTDQQPVRIGIIGCGVIAQYHARALQDYPAARLVAVADLREDVARGMAAEFGGVKAYFDAQELLDDPELDGVVLALPTFARKELGLAALAAGKHILTEKPVAMNAGEVRELMAAQGNLVAACCSARYRFTTIAERATAFLRSGRLGKLRHVRCRVVGPAGPPPEQMPPVWRLSKTLNGGGILVNWGCYDLDFLLGILDWQLRPRRASGQTFSFPPQFADRLPEGTDAETHAIGLIHCDDGITLSYERAEMYPGPASAAWEIVGDGGTLELKMNGGEVPHVVFHAAPAAGGLNPETIFEGPDGFEDSHSGPVRNFAAAIRGLEEVKTPLKHALVVAQIADGIYESARLGRCVEIG